MNCLVPAFAPRAAGCFPVVEANGLCYIAVTILNIQDGTSTTAHLPIGSAAELAGVMSAAAASLVDADEIYRRSKQFEEEAEEEL